DEVDQPGPQHDAGHHQGRDHGERDEPPQPPGAVAPPAPPPPAPPGTGVRPRRGVQQGAAVTAEPPSRRAGRAAHRAPRALDGGPWPAAAAAAVGSGRRASGRPGRTGPSGSRSGSRPPGAGSAGTPAGTTGPSGSRSGLRPPSAVPGDVPAGSSGSRSGSRPG